MHKLSIVSQPDELIARLPGTGTVFVHGASATPLPLLEAMCANASRFRELELIHLHTVGDAPHADPKFAGNFRLTNLFVGGNLRGRLDYDRVDYLPCFLSEIPLLFRQGIKPLAAALIQVSPPDSHGYCSLGTSIDVARAAVEHAGLVLAWINPRMPRTHGDSMIHVSQIHAAWEKEAPLPEAPCPPLTDTDIEIGRLVASLVEDGATLQVGIGGIPNAALAALRHHRHLGVHTEMFSDGVIDLLKCGAVDNSRKKVHAGKTVTGFCSGSRALYDYVDDNPAVVFFESDYVNRAGNIARNPRVTAINSAVEVDLTGQVCADSVGPHILSGVGGQMDFIRGATLSENGRPIIALPSRTKKGESRLVSCLKNGAGVVTTRAHTRFVITEFGIADLFGKTLGQRAKALISIAHPGDRDRLASEWRKLYG
jgi:4-hydroxybutyrate CoA-transferase